ncbi:MAG: PIG-L deacetylase family protein [Planctomycetales bacterium]
MPMPRLFSLCLCSLFLGLSLSTSGFTAEPAVPAKPLKILVCGAHPDDPESGCGGLISLLAQQGHEVSVLYAVTYRQGRSYFNRPEKEVRREEAAAACAIMGAKPMFFDDAAGEFYADQKSLAKLTKLLEEQKPDIVLTHWPVDTHPDHAAMSALVWRCYQRPGGWNLYYFEVNPNHQTLAYQPNRYLDIGTVRDKKYQALMRHTSQKPETIWADHHDPAQQRRGKECGVAHAEAFLLVEEKAGCPVLPVKMLTPGK